MKIALTALLLALFLASPAVSQAAPQEENTTPSWDHGDNVASITYRNLQIERIYELRDSYLVIYNKLHSVDMGHAVIPKSWTDNSGGTRKLSFRAVPPGINPYMTVVTQNGSFYKVYLTVPPDRRNSVWAFAANGTRVDGADAETLEIEY